MNIVHLVVEVETVGMESERPSKRRDVAIALERAPTNQTGEPSGPERYQNP